MSKYKPNTQIHKDAKKFFESEYFHSLTGLDGQAVLRDLMKKLGKKKSELRDEKPVPTKHKRRVLCLENGAVYDSIREAAKVFGCFASSVQRVCEGSQQSTNGLHFEYVKEGKRIDAE